MRHKRGLVIGGGSAGCRHAEVLRTLIPSVDHIHVSSRDFESWWQMFGSESEEDSIGIDFAIIASPAPMHLSQATAIANVSIPMLIEKPVTANLEEARLLEEHLSQRLALSQVGYVLRHTPGFEFFQETIHRLGNADVTKIGITSHSFLPDWRKNTPYRESVSANPGLGGGVLLELSHELDYATALFGVMEIISAKTSTSTELEMDVESVAVIKGRLTNGASVTISLDMGNRNLERFCEVAWKNGAKVRWDIFKGTVSQTGADGGVTDTKSFPSNRDDWYRKQLEYFLGVVDNLHQPVPSVKDAVRTMELITSVWKHARGKQ